MQTDEENQGLMGLFSSTIYHLFNSLFWPLTDSLKRVDRMEGYAKDICIIDPIVVHSPLFRLRVYRFAATCKSRPCGRAG